MTAPVSPFVLLETLEGAKSIDARAIVGVIDRQPDNPTVLVLSLSTAYGDVRIECFDIEQADAFVLLLHAAREKHDDQRAEDARARGTGEAIREGAAVIAGQVAEALRGSFDLAVVAKRMRGLEADLAEERKLVAAYRAHVERVEQLLARARAAMRADADEWRPAFLAEIDAALAGRGMVTRG